MKTALGHLAATTLVAAFTIGCHGDEAPTRLQITELDPNYAVAGDTAFDLLVIGTGFDEISEVFWNLELVSTRFINNRRLVARIGSENITEPMRARIFVRQESGPAFDNDFRTISVTFPVIPEVLEVAPEGPVLSVGETFALEAKGTLANGESADVTPFVDWSSSQPEIATIDASGTIVGLAPGTATITATYVDFPSLLESVTVRVVAG